MQWTDGAQSFITAKFVDVTGRRGLRCEWRLAAATQRDGPEVAALCTERVGPTAANWAAEIATRSTNNNDYHYPFRTYVNRYRLIAANGHADNHVFWTASPSSVSTLVAMDRWLAAVEADQSADPLEVKIVRDKPADILIACWISGVMVTDQSRCNDIPTSVSRARSRARIPPSTR